MQPLVPDCAFVHLSDAHHTLLLHIVPNMSLARRGSCVGEAFEVEGQDIPRDRTCSAAVSRIFCRGRLRTVSRRLDRVRTVGMSSYGS
jgi:hypothetical protein